MKLFHFSRKVNIVLKGVNQGVFIKDENGNVKVFKIDGHGKVQLFPEENSKDGPRNCKKVSFKKLPLYMATILVFATLTLVSVNVFDKTSKEEKLYNRFYEKLEDDSQKFFEDNSAFSEAKRKYEEGEANVALLLLELLPKSNEIEKTFYQALLYMDTDKHMAAIEKFKTVLQNKAYLDIHPTANWYLGLCYLKLGDAESAKSALSCIDSDSFVDYKKSQCLLKGISKVTD